MAAVSGEMSTIFPTRMVMFTPVVTNKAPYMTGKSHMPPIQANSDRCSPMATQPWERASVSGTAFKVSTIDSDNGAS